MVKRRRVKSTRNSGEGKYKAFNAFLILVILFFILFFISQLPKKERLVKEKKPAEFKAVIVRPAATVQKKVEPSAIITSKPAVKVTSKTKPLAVTPLKIKEALPLAIKGKIAIVIDDWGYHINSIDILDAKQFKLTAAILPNLAYTNSVSEELNKRGFEIMLHLPMQPKENIGLEKDTIMTSSPDKDILRIVEQDVREISHVKGINNHMGSLATSDLRTMTLVFKQLNRKHLYYLDSFVSSDSVCEDLAKKFKVSFAKRDIFLDNNPEPEYIRNQISKLKLLAASRGWAIAIGHDRKNTLEVLREELPKIKEEGYKLVYVSELVN